MDNNSNYQDSQTADQDMGGQGGGYDTAQGGFGEGPQHDMGGGHGAMGSGVAGGYEGNNSNSNNNNNGGGGGFNSQSTQGHGQQSQGQQSQEKQDWLDKGLGMLGKKAGHTVVSGSGAYSVLMGADDMM